MKRILTSLLAVTLAMVVLAGCSAGKNVPVKDIMAKVLEQVTSVKDLSSIDVTSKDLSAMDKDALTFMGIKTEDVEEGMVRFSMIGLQADEVIILKMKDKDSVAATVEAIKAHVEVKKESFKDYIPENYTLVENHVLKTKGQYILLAISKDAEKIATIFEDSLK